jgi:hypothetical protein
VAGFVVEETRSFPEGLTANARRAIMVNSIYCGDFMKWGGPMQALFFNFFSLSPPAKRGERVGERGTKHDGGRVQVGLPGVTASSPLPHSR